MFLYNRVTDNFTPVPYDKSKGKHNVTDIAQDAAGNLWIATGNGLFRFHPNDTSLLKGKGRIYAFKHNENNKNSLSSIVLTSLVIDKHNNLWIGTENGLNKFLIKHKKFSYFPYQAENKPEAHNKINDICIGKDGKNLWIGTDFGLKKFNLNRYAFTCYISDPDDKNSPSCNIITAVAEDHSNTLWVGTEGGGLNKFNISREVFYHYKNDPADPYSLSVDNVMHIYHDEANILWVGTSLGGVNKADRASEGWVLYRNNPFDPYSLNMNQIRTIYQDRNGGFWIGTVEGGLNQWDRENDRFYHYTHDPHNPHSIRHNHVREILEDSRGNFWVATEGGGLELFDRKTKRFKHHLHDPDDPATISCNKLWNIYEDSRGRLWICTFGGGLNEYDYKTGTFSTVRHDPDNPHSLSDDNVTCAFEDHAGVFWVGTFGGGLNRWEEDKQHFTRFKYNPDDSTSISNNRIYSIVEDSEGTLWIGTKGNLNKYIRGQNCFTSYSEKDGLPNDVVMGILEDNNGNLWISTNKGISKFDKEKKFCNYDVKDGLQDNEFLVNSFYKAKDGMMLFGGINGFNAFYPEDIKPNKYIPEVDITGFQIFNEPADLDTCISEKKHLVLSYWDKQLSFEFVVMNYIFPEKNQYAYKMEGFDKDWNYIGTRRYANYTNLKPGRYTLRVKGSNNDGIWNEEGTSLRITIVPPFWMTTWFYILIIIAALIIVYTYIKLRERKLKRDKRILEETVRRRTAEIVEKKEEIEQQRDKIAHQNHEIKSSIHYASRLQKAILPPQEVIDHLLPDSFVLYKPRDIVSGDFYWIIARDGKLYFSAVDCTGHGVPGAFMSIVGFQGLNRAVREYHLEKPAEILDKLNEIVAETLRQQGKGDLKDGMDMALCVLDPKTNTLEYAGANNPLYYIRKKGAEFLLSTGEKTEPSVSDGEWNLYAVKANKQPIGAYIKQEKFTNHTFQMEKGDTIYIFSDGYADQFGGPRGKKFMYKNFRELLFDLSKYPMKNQMSVLDRKIEEWKAYKSMAGGTYEQVDDILVMGVKF